MSAVLPEMASCMLNSWAGRGQNKKVSWSCISSVVAGAGGDARTCVVRPSVSLVAQLLLGLPRDPSPASVSARSSSCSLSNAPKDLRLATCYQIAACIIHCSLSGSGVFNSCLGAYWLAGLKLGTLFFFFFL